MALLMFTGAECTHCHDMDPLVARLEEELDVLVEKLEVWHNAANAARMQKLDDGSCGGVPFFFNEESGKSLCGAVSFEKLKDWAKIK